MALVNEWRRRGWDVTRTPTRWRALLLPHTERPAVTLSPKTKCHGECTPSNQNEIFLLLLRGRSTQALTHAHPPAVAFCVTLLPRLAAVVPPNLLMHADTAAILLYPKVDHRIQRDSSVGREKKFHSTCTFVSITDTVGILKKCLWSKQQTFYTVWAVNGCFPLFFSCSFEACSRAFSRLLWNSTSACCPYCLTAALFTLFLSKITRHCPECIDAGSKKLRPGLRRKNSSTRWHGGAVLLLYLSWGGEKKKGHHELLIFLDAAYQRSGQRADERRAQILRFVLSFARWGPHANTCNERALGLKWSFSRDRMQWLEGKRDRNNSACNKGR